MPLKHSSSKKAFVSNLKSELESGKPRKQALAIAYSVQRRSDGGNESMEEFAKRRRKQMALDRRPNRGY